MAKRIFLSLTATLAVLAWTSLAMARIPLPDITELVEKDGPAVVNISTTKTVKAQEDMQDFIQKFHRRGGPSGPMDEFFDQFQRFFGPQGRPRPRKQHSLGSGFVISADGYIVTNNHVVEGADEVKVQFRNHETPMPAKIIGRDKETDLALLKIDGKKDLPYLEFGDSGKMKVGAWVLAIGNPFGLENTVTLGIVSAKGRVIGAGPFDNFIQTDASINPRQLRRTAYRSRRQGHWHQHRHRGLGPGHRLCHPLEYGQGCHRPVARGQKRQARLDRRHHPGHR